MFGVPVRLALVQVTDFQQSLFGKMRSHDLHANWQAVRESAWNGKCRDTGQVYCHNKYIRQIHIQRIGDLLPDSKGCRGRNWCD